MAEFAHGQNTEMIPQAGARKDTGCQTGRGDENKQHTMASKESSKEGWEMLPLTKENQER